MTVNEGYPPVFQTSFEHKVLFCFKVISSLKSENRIHAPSAKLGAFPMC